MNIPPVPSRTIPKKVLDQLRKEVNFMCPFKNCDSPFLTWHHFDPPWGVKKHHEPSGLIALCAHHANQADGGAYTVEQLKSLKKAPHSTEEVAGALAWLRKLFLVKLAGNYYYSCDRLLEIGDTRVVWFTRDVEGNALLNLNIPSSAGKPNLRLIGNVWSIPSNSAASIICPPQAKKLEIVDKNGDEFSVKFFEIDDNSALAMAFPDLQLDPGIIQLPCTAMELHISITSEGLKLDRDSTTLGPSYFKGCFTSNPRSAAVKWVPPPGLEQRLFGHCESDGFQGI